MKAANNQQKNLLLESRLQIQVCRYLAAQINLYFIYRFLSFIFIGYGATCVALLLSATTILNEFDKLPGTGGVLTPGACFAKTDLISNLGKNGFKFEVISEHEDKKKDE